MYDTATTNALTDASIGGLVWLIHLLPLALVIAATWSWIDSRKRAREDAAYEALMAPERIQRAKDRIVEDELRKRAWLASEARRAHELVVLDELRAKRAASPEGAAIEAAWAAIDRDRDRKRGHLRAAQRATDAN